MLNTPAEKKRRLEAFDNRPSATMTAAQVRKKQGR
jgi:hypothetical protein